MVGYFVRCWFRLQGGQMFIAAEARRCFSSGGAECFTYLDKTLLRSFEFFHVGKSINISSLRD